MCLSGYRTGRQRIRLGIISPRHITGSSSCRASGSRSAWMPWAEDTERSPPFPNTLSALDAGQGHPLQEGALHTEKDDDQRQRRERRGRHQQVPLSRVLSPKGEESQGERILAAIRQVDQGPKELVPGPD